MKMMKTTASVLAFVLSLATGSLASVDLAFCGDLEFRPSTFPGKYFAVRCSLTNYGTETVPAVSLKYYTGPTGTDLIVETYFPNVPPGGTCEGGTWYGNIPSNNIPLGEYDLHCYIDEPGQIPETDESNNHIVSSTKLVIGAKIPNVVGMSRGQAESTLAEADMLVDDIWWAPSDLPEGTVLQQSLEPGRIVMPGYKVDLTLSQGDTGTVPPVQPTGCLAAHWKLDETSGTTAADSSDNKCNGTLSGGPAWQATGGKLGGALQFDGVNDYIDCGNPAALKIQDKITLACWIKAPSFTRAWQAILAKGDDSYRLTRSSAGNSVYFGLGGTSVGGFDGATEVADNEWHHVAGVYDGANATLYIDGVADTAVPATGKINANSYNLFIGENSQSRGRYFKGLIDDVRIYSVALNDSQVQAAMQGTPGCAAGPVAHWMLDETSGTIAVDSVGENDGALLGDPAWQPTGGRLAGALKFDGLNDRVTCGTFNPSAATGMLSVCLWAKWNGHTGNWQTLIAKRDAWNANDMMWQIEAHSSTDTLGFFREGSTPEDGDPKLRVGQWEHVAATFDGTTATFYVNGVPTGSGPFSFGSGAQAAVVFGASQTNGENPFNGALDDVRLYDRALSPAEVAQLAAEGAASQVTVPDVVGMVQATAQSTITSAGLVVGTVTQTSSSTVAQGKVISQNPAAGTSAAPGSSVNLVISSGPTPTTVQVPNVVGMTQAAAQTTITSGGLVAGTVTEASTSTIALYSVISQNPAAGTSVTRGSSVNLVVASGPSVGPGNACLIARWKLDEVSGALAKDSAGTNNATLRNGPVWQPTAGKFSGALSFDGVDDYLDCGNSTAFNLGQQVTLAAWVNTQDAGKSAHRDWLSKGDHTYTLKYNVLNQVEFCIYDGAWFTATYPAGSSFNGAWHHVAGTYDGSAAKLYVDGALQATTPHVGHTETRTHNLYIGANSELAGRNSHSLIDDVRIYSCALTAAEVGLLAGKPPAEPNLVGWWKLDETGGTVTYDSAGMNDGTVYGGSLWQPTGGKTGGSLKFDGVNDYVQLPVGPVVKSLTHSTFATWVNWSGGSDWQRIFDFGTGTQVSMYLTPRTSDSGVLRFAITTASTAGEDQANSPQVLPSGWHHVAVTIDATSKTHILYLDGQVKAAKTGTRYTPSSLGTTTQNWLGKSQWPDPLFNGSLDDFRIYNRVLTAQEIQQLAGVKSGGSNR